jgi:hypothetical protein
MEVRAGRHAQIIPMAISAALEKRLAKLSRRGGGLGAEKKKGEVDGWILREKVDALDNIGMIGRVSVLNDQNQPHNGRHAGQPPRCQNN